MTIVKPTLKHILLIWLSITLRALVWGIAAAFAAAILISIAVAVTGGGEEQIQVYAGIAGPVIGLPVSFCAAYAQFGRKCAGVRLVLVSAD